jgi:hypothetical protein
MSWREERDALIAQTLAFVQSVTGKPADFAQLGTSQSEVPQPAGPQPGVAAPAALGPASGAVPAALAADPKAHDAVPHGAARESSLENKGLTTDPKPGARNDTQLDAGADVLEATGFEVMRAEAAMIDAAIRLVSIKPTTEPVAPSPAGPSREPGATRAENQLTATAALPVDGHAETQQPEFTGEHFTSITSELGLQRDIQTEIKARVATFRANQERFNRERQEYFSSTLAKLRASISDTPPSDK